MKQVGIVGWRGMVGSVLLQRMIEENDFDDISAHFFSTSSAGGVGPVINGKSDILKDANSLSALAEMDIIITCQGGDNSVFSEGISFDSAALMNTMVFDSK